MIKWIFNLVKREYKIKKKMKKKINVLGFCKIEKNFDVLI